MQQHSATTTMQRQSIPRASTRAPIPGSIRRLGGGLLLAFAMLAIVDDGAASAASVSVSANPIINPLGTTVAVNAAVVSSVGRATGKVTFKEGQTFLGAGSLSWRDSLRTIALGPSHACAVTDTGGAKCWGQNAYFELGNGSSTPSGIPVDVVGLTSGVQTVATGAVFSCALTTTGGVKCWGNGSVGSLGNGSLGNSSVPVDVMGLQADVSAIAASSGHACALLRSGAVTCWGENNRGQLGDGTTDHKASPVAVSGLTDATALGLGPEHSCAIRTNGEAVCWGRNSSGQLGNGSRIDATIPVRVGNLYAATAIAGGSHHSCAVTARGVVCWGANESGQLGVGSTDDLGWQRTFILEGAGVTAVTAGDRHSCVVRVFGGLSCWGANPWGQLGTGDNFDTLSPKSVIGLSGVAMVAAAGNTTCAVAADNAVKCWGSNWNGQLGNGSLGLSEAQYFHGSEYPVVASGLTAKTTGMTMTIGGAHACAIAVSGGAKCWGENSAGQLGSGAGVTERASVPQSVADLEAGAAAIAAGYESTCALTTVGAVACWGSNDYGQLGIRTSSDLTAPVWPPNLDSGIVAIAAGDWHACALTETGTVKCWGRNSDGQLGDGTTVSSSEPVTVSGLSGITAITAGASHSCAIDATGAALCWGRNGDGQLGNGSTVSSTTPVGVVGLNAGVTAIDAGGYHTCAVISGGATCWGRNGRGQLGSATTVAQSEPTAVVGLGAGVHAITAGFQHSCALLSNYRMKCWGANSLSQLGAGDTFDAAIPTEVLDVSGIVQIAAGGDSTCATAATGVVRCWGSGWQGQLGNGSTRFAGSARPVTVSGLTGVVHAGIDLSIADLTLGSHRITAIYDGDGALRGTRATDHVTVRVVKAKTTSALIAPSSSVQHGRSVRLTASVVRSDPGSGRPTGQMTFTDGGITLGSVALFGGKASLTLADLAVGSHTIGARYDGDEGHATSASETAVIVVEKATSATALAVSPTGSVAGQPVTLQATVVGTGAVGGQVVFTAGGTTLGTVDLKGGKARLTTRALERGNNRVVATYGGNAVSVGSASPARTVTVAKADALAVLTPHRTEILPGERTRLTARVSAVAPASGRPTGTVTFKDGGKVIGRLSLENGSVSLDTPALATGRHVFTLRYDGSADFAATESAAATVTADPRIGPEFLVNTRRTGAQQAAVGATLKSGGWVLVWTSQGQDAAGTSGVYAQLYAADGARMGGETLVNVTRPGDQVAPSVAGLADGGFVVGWRGEDPAGDSLGLFARRFGADGKPIGAEIRIDRTNTGPAQSGPALVARAGGGFVAAWSTNSALAPRSFAVFSRAFTATAAPTGTEVKTNATALTRLPPQVGLSALAGGFHVAVWTSSDAVPVVRARRLTAALQPASSSDISVSTTSGPQFATSEPVVAGTADGGFVVAWTDAGKDGSGKGVFARRYKNTGAAATAPFQVAEAAAGSQSQPTVAGRPGGGFTIGWMSAAGGVAGADVFARRFTAAGAKTDTELQLNTTVTDAQTLPAILERTATTALAVWTSNQQDGSLQGIYAQRLQYSPAP